MTAIRYLLDEHMSRRVAAGLGARGVESITVHEAGRRGGTDASHLEWANEFGWIAVTHDRRFAGLARTSSEHAGLIFCAKQKYGIGGLVGAREELARSETMESMRGRVHYL